MPKVAGVILACVISGLIGGAVVAFWPRPQRPAATVPWHRDLAHSLNRVPVGIAWIKTSGAQGGGERPYLRVRSNSGDVSLLGVCFHNNDGIPAAFDWQKARLTAESLTATSEKFQDAWARKWWLSDPDAIGPMPRGSRQDFPVDSHNLITNEVGEVFGMPKSAANAPMDDEFLKRHVLQKREGLFFHPTHNSMPEFFKQLYVVEIKLHDSRVYFSYGRD